MENRNLLLSFDYELFLGTKSGTVEKCLLEPTYILIDLFEKYNIKNAVFFVDTTYLIRLKNEAASACKTDFLLIMEQLQLLIKKGHYVFPHIHPHWQDAIYQPVQNQWSLKDYTKYRFHKVSDEEKKFLFDESIKILEAIIYPVNKDYKINSYRAGGWSIQPFTDFKPFFEQYGIVNEFSVVPGFRNLSDAQYFDFTAAPSKRIYRFENDPLIESVNGNFKEYTISTFEVSSSAYLLNKIWGKYLWKTGQRSIGNGSGVVMPARSDQGRKETLGSDNSEMISIELLTKVKLHAYKIFLRNNSYMHFISHPKMLSSHNIKTFASFLRFACGKYNLITDFSSFSLM